jgi:hypothetical protein
MISAWKNRETWHELSPDCWCDDRYSNWAPQQCKKGALPLKLTCAELSAEWQQWLPGRHSVYLNLKLCEVPAVTKLMSTWIDRRTKTVLTNWCLLTFCCLLVNVVACMRASLLQSNHIDRLVSNSPSFLCPILTCWTPWSWVLLDKLIVAQLLKKILEFYGTRVYKMPPLAPILFRIIPAQSYFLNIQFNIIQSIPRSS